MLEGRKLDRIRELAWRELELAEQEDVLVGGATETPVPTPVLREPRPSRRLTLTHLERHDRWPLG